MFASHRIIDLSVPLEHQVISEPFPASIHYCTHEAVGLQQMQAAFGVTPEHLTWSQGQGWAVEHVQAPTHTGTHVDAPYHYGAISGRKPASRIDEVPLDWVFLSGVVLDVRHKPAGDLITVDDLQHCLDAIGYELKEFDIVLLQTGADKRIDSAECFRQPSPGRDGAL